MSTHFSGKSSRISHQLAFINGHQGKFGHPLSDPLTDRFNGLLHLLSLGVVQLLGVGEDLLLHGVFHQALLLGQSQMPLVGKLVSEGCVSGIGPREVLA